MEQLESMLQNISSTEREEALQYYNDYFDDAGIENEQEVMDTLDSPQYIAENIIRDITGGDEPSFSYNTNRTANQRAVVEYQQSDANGDATQTGTNATQQGTNQEVKKEQGLSSGVIALIIILLVLTSPLWIGFVFGGLGLIFGFLVTWFALIFAFAAISFSLIVVLGVLLVAGIMCMSISPLAGVAVIGGGLICGGLGILFLMLTVAMSGIATPAICRGIAHLYRMIFKKKA